MKKSKSKKKLLQSGKVSTLSGIVILIIIALIIGAGVLAYKYYYVDIVKEELGEETYEEIAQRLMQDYLEQYKSQEVPLKLRINDYSVNKINVEIIKDNCFGFAVNYSVNTYKSQNNNWTDWIAGSGTLEGDWIKNQSMAMNAVKEGNYYKMKIVGTGRGNTDCTTGSPSSPIRLPITPTNEINETSDWKTYRNEEYGFEMKYPGGLIISYVEVDDFSGPGEGDYCIDKLAYYKENGLRYCKSVVGFKDPDNGAVFGLFIYKKEKTPDLGNPNVWFHPTKDYTYALLKTGNERSDIIENNWDRIMFSFNLIDETGKISIKISFTETTFNMEDKSFETEDFTTGKKFTVITDDSTKFYKITGNKIIEDGYSGFSDFANAMQTCEGINCPLVPTVEGILQGTNTIKATDIYSLIQ